MSIGLPGLGQCIQCMMISAGWYYALSDKVRYEKSPPLAIG